MGNRFAGSIEPGAMPKLHRYFGTPVTTWILNLIYGSKYSDIHCGMRALTREALARIRLESQSWEYASEMVLKAALLKLRVAEVPVKFYKDRDGRVSHHKRAGWLSPWVAGWINLKAMFLYAPDCFVRRPGWVLLTLGLALTSEPVRGALQAGRRGIRPALDAPGNDPVHARLTAHFNWPRWSGPFITSTPNRLNRAGAAVHLQPRSPRRDGADRRRWACSTGPCSGPGFIAACGSATCRTPPCSGYC